MKAIPTTYNGVNYRSLLEARYACWFDLVGLPVQYEPEAWPGYIPDFLFSGHPGDRERLYSTDDSAALPHILFEIKGALELFDPAKIRRAGYSGAIVCLDGRGPEHAHVPGGALCMADSGGGFELSWPDAAAAIGIDNMGRAWHEAGNRVQWKGRGA
jgi:hypothetical protein